MSEIKRFADLIQTRLRAAFPDADPKLIGMLLVWMLPLELPAGLTTDEAVERFYPAYEQAVREGLEESARMSKFAEMIGQRLANVANRVELDSVRAAT
jgi:hypothetical protein